MIKQTVIILFLFIPTLAFTKFSYFDRQLSFYYGQTYRIGDKFYNLFDISIENYFHTCLQSKYSGMGIRLDYFKNDNYSLGIKYFRQLKRRARYFLTPYWGISPIIFQYNKIYGVNIKPELGIRIHIGEPWVFIGATLNISYGYDIPIISISNYEISRHDFAARIALTFDIAGLLPRRTTRTDEKNENEKIE